MLKNYVALSDMIFFISMPILDDVCFSGKMFIVIQCLSVK